MLSKYLGFYFQEIGVRPLRDIKLELAFGIALIMLDGLWIFMGKVTIRYYGWVYRSEKPARFWWHIAVYFLGGLLLIAHSIYQMQRITSPGSL